MRRVIESVRLLFSQGSSDKEYVASLVEVEGGHLVEFQYGRRDSALKAGTKTASPVELAAAKKVYDKLVASKVSEGYTTGESGVAFQGGENEQRISGLLPQLLNAIDEDELEAFLGDDRHIGQQKHDGERRMLRAVAGLEVVGINRKGLTVPLPMPVVKSVASLSCVLDGELVGSVLYAFDILEYDGQDLRSQGCLSRIQVLERVGQGFGEAVKVVGTAIGRQAKRELLARVRELGQEGMVFKRADAPYESGRPNSGGSQRKFKLVESATVRVRSVNGSKRSVEVEVSMPDIVDGHPVYRDVVVSVGSVTIPANHSMPAAGALVEVEYLYCFEGGSLFQPVYKGPRKDLEANDLSVISVRQLKFKKAHAEALAA
jgi:bifunctional non-homologous end joining protein LigD